MQSRFMAMALIVAGLMGASAAQADKNAAQADENLKFFSVVTEIEVGTGENPNQASFGNYKVTSLNREVVIKKNDTNAEACIKLALISMVKQFRLTVKRIGESTLQCYLEDDA